MSKIKLVESISLKDFEKEINEELKKIIDFFEKELSKLRTNRAHPSIIEDILVIHYGTQTQLKHISVISATESNMLTVQPFDHSTLHDIEKALSTSSDLGGVVKNDGKTIKITFPPMSQERRQDIIKSIAKKQEISLISARKTRQDYVNTIKKAEKDKHISKDLSEKLQKMLQNIIDLASNNINTLSQKKEKSIMQS